MLKITVSSKDLFEQGSDCYAVCVQEDVAISKYLKNFDKQCTASLQALVKEQQFTGKAGQTATLPIYHEKRLFYVVLAGLGKQTKDTEQTPLDTETYRRAIGKVVRIAEQKKVKSIAFELPDPKLFEADAEYIAEQTVLIAHMAAYKCTEFLTGKDVKTSVREAVVVFGKLNKKQVHDGVKKANIVAESVNLARHWVDLPPSRLTPPDLAKNAQQIAKKYGLKITVFNEKEVNQMGMGGLAGVSKGSDRDCQLVIMEYKGKKNAPTLAFVGKGITFDSGGLSLKPPAYMETMKEDMSGAAAVIATMQAVAQLQPDVNIVCIAPLSENLPSGKATKPGDVLKFYNGKTAEVKNTDAEGRLVLGDALSYAVKHYKPDAMIDLATLTGACAHALGPFFSGLMSQHHELADKIEAAAEFSGDRVWQLPLHNDYKPAIKSEIADICNIGKRQYMAGAITAGFFLQNFVGDTKWAHLDIAGTAFNVPDIPYYRPEGATGVGVRLLVDLALHW